MYGADEETALNVDNAESSSSVRPLGSDGQPMSKNAMKRAAKQARFDAKKPERRAAERIKKKQRAAYLARGYAEGTLSVEEQAVLEKRRELKAKRNGTANNNGEVWPGGVVMDLGFDELMTDQEITSMASQIGYVYSVNRTAARPFSEILHTSFSSSDSPRLWAKMSRNGRERWQRSSWWPRGIRDLARALDGPTSSHDVVQSESISGSVPTDGEPGPNERACPVASGPVESPLEGSPLPLGWQRGMHKLIYLSADSDEELTTLHEDEVYIIGGIVDRNRHKMLCENKAKKLGIRTARLPIGTFLADMPTRKVLTVNQVFEILVSYIEFQDWAKAFDSVIPRRKYEAIGKKGKKRRVNVEKQVAGGDEDDHESVTRGDDMDILEQDG